MTQESWDPSCLTGSVLVGSRGLNAFKGFEEMGFLGMKLEESF